jgi:acetyl-CoA/propionyl-CoA carboxylase, biotin carboxylase, biotin carboxyl carrier protein
LRETTITGVHTTIPADLAILEHPDFAAAIHSTKWVEDKLDLSGLVATKGSTETMPGAEGEPARVRRDLDVEVNGKRFAVKAWVPESGPVVGVAAGSAGAGAAAKPKRAASSGGAAAGGSGSVAVPMQGTIVKVLVEIGQTVEAGAAVVVLEAMKMENHINAEKSGVVKEIKVKAGDTVGAGDVVVVIE